MKGIGGKFRVHIRLHNDPHGASWPFFKVVGGNAKNVEDAFIALRNVANIANEKNPRVGNRGSPGPLPSSTAPPPPQSAVGPTPTSPDYTPTSPGYITKQEDPMEVERVTAEDGKEYLVAVGEGGVRKVVNDDGHEVGVYIAGENKVHLN